MSYDAPPPPPSGAPYQQPMNAAPYAGWGARFGARLIDGLLTIPGVILMVIALTQYLGDVQEVTAIDPNTGMTTATGPTPGFPILYWVGLLIILAIAVWNLGYRQGTTGQSVGKKVLGIKTVKIATGEPLGFGMALVRYVIDFINAIPCYLGYLWPAWDAKKQTFTDKIVSSVVIKVPKA